jgi:hypothetical protein
MNTTIRDWMPRQAAEADRAFQDMYGTTLAERFRPDKHQWITLHAPTLKVYSNWILTFLDPKMWYNACYVSGGLSQALDSR